MHSNGKIRVAITNNNKQEHLGFCDNSIEGINRAKFMYWTRKLEIANIYLQEYNFLENDIKNAIIDKVKIQASEESIELK